MSHTVTMGAKSVDGSTPGGRVTWNTTVPPECVASVRVEFRHSRTMSVVRSYTTIPIHKRLRSFRLVSSVVEYTPSE